MFRQQENPTEIRQQQCFASLLVLLVVGLSLLRVYLQAKRPEAGQVTPSRL
jgi:hypothetical protein